MGSKRQSSTASSGSDDKDFEKSLEATDEQQATVIGEQGADSLPPVGDLGGEQDPKADGVEGLSVAGPSSLAADWPQCERLVALLVEWDYIEDPADAATLDSLCEAAIEALESADSVADDWRQWTRDIAQAVLGTDETKDVALEDLVPRIKAKLDDLRSNGGTDETKSREPKSGETYTVAEAFALAAPEPELSAAINMASALLCGVAGIPLVGELRRPDGKVEALYRVERDRGEAEVIYGPTQHRLNRITEDVRNLQDSRGQKSQDMQTKLKELPELREAVQRHTNAALEAIDDPEKLKLLGGNPIARAQKLSLELMGKTFSDIEAILVSDAQKELDEKREREIEQIAADRKLNREEAEQLIPKVNAPGLSEQAREVGEACIAMRSVIDDIDAQIKALHDEESALLKSRTRVVIVVSRPEVD